MMEQERQHHSTNRKSTRFGLEKTRKDSRRWKKKAAWLALITVPLGRE